jgi:putative endonuclease
MRRNRQLRTATWGEGVAAVWLRLKGYRVLAQNWRCPVGEIDLVCLQRDTVVFVEVKTRSGTGHGAPEEAVDGPKRRRLLKLAGIYLAGHGLADAPCRFDVVAVVRGGLIPTLRHLKSAFRADSG